MKLVSRHNAGTPTEVRIYETGEDEYPYLVKTPRGDWQATDMFGALAVQGNYRRLPLNRTVRLV